MGSLPPGPHAPLVVTGKGSGGGEGEKVKPTGPLSTLSGSWRALEGTALSKTVSTSRSWKSWGRGGLAELTPVSWLQSRLWSPQETPQPLSLPRASCSNGDKVNPFPGRPGDRLCSQRNTARLWAAAETHTGTIGASRSRRAVQAPTAEQAHSASRPQPRQKHPLPQQLGSRLREPSRAPQSLFFFSRRHPHPHLVPQGKPLQLPDGNHNYASVSGGPGPSPH